MSQTQLHNVRVYGLGLTDDFLLHLSSREQTKSIPHATPEGYDLPPKTPLEEAILDAWDDARKAWAKFQTHQTDPWSGWSPAVTHAGLQLRRLERDFTRR